MKYRILCLVDKTSDAMAYYRSALPLIRMTQDYEGISVDFISPQTNPTWDLLSRYNVLFVQRPDSQADVDFIAKCRVHKLKVWVDFDDALWAVTPDSPAFMHYNKQDTRDAIMECIGYAHTLTVSTEGLRDSLKAFSGRDSHVIVNSADLTGMQYLTSLKSENDTIIWRGSHTHDNDLMSVENDLVELDGKFDLNWLFMGRNPWWISQKLKRSVHQDYIGECTIYFETLRRIKGNMMYIPLVDNEFNRCKSNIAALEGICCGLVPVVPLWWEDMNVFGEAPFRERMEKMIGMDQATKTSLHRNLKELVGDCYNLHDANEKRYQILMGL